MIVKVMKTLPTNVISEIVCVCVVMVVTVVVILVGIGRRSAASLVRLCSQGHTRR
jgi:hypothetical protein